MNRLNPESIGDVLREVFRQSCMEQRLDECKAVDLWPIAVGQEIAMQCRRPTVSKGVMTVGVSDPALRNELSMHRSRLRDMINDMLGKSILTDLRFSS